MKRILITGDQSYIGISLEKWLLKEPEKYKVNTLDMKMENWKEHDFSIYDVVFHVAGIAHVRESKKNRELYYKINRDLAFETAQMSKTAGVSHFIFLSSMSIYGMEEGIITKETIPQPKSAYGKSKLEAEVKIRELEEEDFAVAIIRPPMVYGKNCKGNYAKLSKIARKTLIFPKINNQRSMIYIDNLSEFSKEIIDNRNSGIFHPQNKDYVNTSEMVRIIREIYEKKIIITPRINFLFKIAKVDVVRKVFGSLVYQKGITTDMDAVSFYDSIVRTEGFQEDLL